MYLVVQTLVVVGVFLAVAGFFASWDGVAVGVRPPAGEAPKVYQVIVVGDDGEVIERPMPAYAVVNMGLPVLSLGVPPDPIPDDAPRTSKLRYRLHYLVQTRPEGASAPTWVRVPTTTPQALGLAVVLWLVGLGIRNMAYAGSPFWIERSALFLPRAQTGAGSVAPARNRGRKGPPPGRRRRGPRR